MTTLIIFSACGGGGGDGGSGGSSASCDPIKIAGGTSCEVTNSAVVKLHLTKPDGLFSCSGTMVASNVVLTAGHCVARATSVRIEASDGSSTMADTTRVNSSFFAPPYAFDLGFLIVPPSFAAEANITPIPIYLGADILLSAGTPLSVYGYGQEDSNDGFGKFPRVANMVVTQIIFPNDFESDFSFTAIADRNAADQGAACKGDSGGPAIGADPATGAVGIVGVVAREVGAESCSSTNSETRFSGATCELVSVIRQFTNDLRTVAECI